MVGQQPPLVSTAFACCLLAAFSQAIYATEPQTPALAQPQPSKPSLPANPSGSTPNPGQSGQPGKNLGQLPTKTPMGPEFENVRNALNALTPEQLQRFQQNFLRWSNLSPEEKKLLRERDTLQRQKMMTEAQNSLAKTGLQLSEEQKTQFFKRYGEERRKIEEGIRQEMETVRKPRVESLIQQLKSEFSVQPESGKTP